jgi:hypothetical protein
MQEVRDLMLDHAAAASTHQQQQLPAHSSGLRNNHRIAGGQDVTAALEGPSKGLRVQDDAFKGVHVEGLLEEGLRSAEHLEMLLRAVEAKRHVSRTQHDTEHDTELVF